MSAKQYSLKFFFSSFKLHTISIDMCWMNVEALRCMLWLDCRSYSRCLSALSLLLMLSYSAEFFYFLPMLQFDYYSSSSTTKKQSKNEVIFSSFLHWLLSVDGLSRIFFFFSLQKIFRIFSLLHYGIKCFRQVDLVLVDEALLKANLSSEEVHPSEPNRANI